MLVALSDDVVAGLRDACDPVALEVIDKHHGIVAGGFCRDTAMGLPPNDLDVYFTDRNLAWAAALQLSRVAGMRLTKSRFAWNVSTVQFLWGWGETLSKVLRRFDFTVNMIGFQGQVGMQHVQTPEHCAGRLLVIPDPSSVGCKQIVGRIKQMQARGFLVANPITPIDYACPSGELVPTSIAGL